MLKQLKRTLCIIFLACLVPQAVQAQDVAKVYTSYFSNVVSEDPDRPGFGYELIRELFKTANLKVEIIPLPWARSQFMAKTTPEALIFPLSWTPTRNIHYNWSVLLFKNYTHFITYKQPKLTAQEARQRSVGVQMKSSWDNWLTEQGYTDIYRVRGDGEELIKLLKADRIDAWYTDSIIANGVIKPLNDPNFIYSDAIQTFETYLATNRDKPYPHMDKLKVAMKKLRDSGRRAEIFKKYNILGDH